MDDFFAFAKNVTRDLKLFTADLQVDLDFAETELSLPVGLDSNYVCHYFYGTFNGNNHVIKNLKMDNTRNWKYKNAALFCGLESGTITNLTIDESCTFSGDISAALGVNGYCSTFNGVTVSASVDALSVGSGFVGKVEGSFSRSFPSINVQGCQNYAHIDMYGSGKTNYMGGYFGLLNSTVTGVYRLGVSFRKNSDNISFNILDSDTVIGSYVGSVENCDALLIDMRENTVKTDVHSVGLTTVGAMVGRLFNSSNLDVVMENNLNSMSERDD